MEVSAASLVAIILQFINVSNRHIVPLELAQCPLPVVSQQSWKNDFQAAGAELETKGGAV